MALATHGEQRAEWPMEDATKTDPGGGYWLASDGDWYPPGAHPDYVAETSPGPGYWLASDGNWYPPADAEAPSVETLDDEAAVQGSAAEDSAVEDRAFDAATQRPDRSEDDEPEFYRRGAGLLPAILGAVSLAILAAAIVAMAFVLLRDEPGPSTDASAPTGAALGEPQSVDAPEPSLVAPNVEAGSPTEPVAFGAPGLASGWQARVVSVTTDAAALLAAESPFNEPPEPGETLVLIELELTNTTDVEGPPFSDLNFILLAGGTEYRVLEENCVADIPDELAVFEPLAPGETLAGNICWRIPSESAAGATFILRPFLTPDSARVFSLS